MSKDINLQIQEAEGTTNRINPKKFTPVKLVKKTKDKKTMEAKGNGTIVSSA